MFQYGDYNKSPDRITEEELRDYFLYTKNVKKWSRSTGTIAICGIKFFFENTLKRDGWTFLDSMIAELKSMCVSAPSANRKYRGKVHPRGFYTNRAKHALDVLARIIRENVT